MHKGTLKYFKVKALLGHMGAGNSRDITFYIEAKNITTATRLAQQMPGVKHSRPVVSAEEVSYDEYICGRQVSAYAR